MCVIYVCLCVCVSYLKHSFYFTIYIPTLTPWVDLLDTTYMRQVSEMHAVLCLTWVHVNICHLWYRSNLNQQSCLQSTVCLSLVHFNPDVFSDKRLSNVDEWLRLEIQRCECASTSRQLISQLIWPRTSYQSAHTTFCPPKKKMVSLLFSLSFLRVVIFIWVWVFVVFVSLLLYFYIFFSLFFSLVWPVKTQSSRMTDCATKTR